jgi:tetratricopeptide (TPR) repeat protein
VEARQLNWEECVHVATQLTQHAPGRSSGWIHRSFALHELKRTQEAYELLLPSLSLFKGIWPIPYNLACYQSQLGQKEPALEFYAQALEIGGESIREMALNDIDLAPLHNEIADD